MDEPKRSRYFYAAKNILTRYHVEDSEGNRQDLCFFKSDEELITFIKYFADLPEAKYTHFDLEPNTWRVFDLLKIKLKRLIQFHPSQNKKVVYCTYGPHNKVIVQIRRAMKDYLHNLCVDEQDEKRKRKLEAIIHAYKNKGREETLKITLTTLERMHAYGEAFPGPIQKIFESLSWTHGDTFLHIKVPHRLFYSGAINKLNGNDLKVLMAIEMHKPAYEGRNFAGLTRVADLLETNRQGVDRAVAALKEKGFLENDREGAGKASGLRKVNIRNNWKTRFVPEALEKQYEEALMDRD